MSAKDEILEYLWQESTVDIHRVAKSIAEAQLEAVCIFASLSGCLNIEQARYISALRKAAEKGE